MSYYDDASLMLLAGGGAEKDGKVYSIKPIPVYSSELVINGDFATDSGWTKGSGWTISGGTANATSASTGTPLSQSIITGKQYKITYDVVSISQGGFQVDLSFSGTALGQLVTTTGIFTDIITSLNPLLSIRAVGTTTGSIGNVSIKEVLVDGDFDFSRGSNLSATRVNASYLIEKGRENLALYSNKFNESYWQKLSGCSIVGQTATDPFGVTNNAWLVAFDGTTNARIERFISGSAIKTMSVYVRTQSGTQDVLIGFGGSDPLITKTITTTWQRVETFTPTGGSYSRLRCDDAVTLEVFGYQIEQGLIATDYIPTTTTTGTAGILENTPRFNYSNGVSCSTLLLEPSRTNLIEQSEYFGGSYWSKQSSGVASAPIVTSNYAISPEGTLNASRVLFDINGGTSSSDFSQLFAAATSIIADVTNSVYIKSNTGFNYNMSFVNALGSSLVSIVVTPEWQRFDITATTVSTASFRLRLRGSESTSDSADVSLWGAQVEAGSYKTSYIPTYGTSQTRAADVCVGAGSASTFNSNEGVLYAELAALADDGTFRILSISNGTRDERIYIQYKPTSNEISGVAKNNDTTQANISFVLSDETQFAKIAFKYKANDFALYVNGVIVGTDTSGTTPVGLNEFSFDQGNRANNFYGKVKEVLTFNSALSNGELSDLTNPYKSYNDFAITFGFTWESQDCTNNSIAALKSLS